MLTLIDGKDLMKKTFLLVLSLFFLLPGAVCAQDEAEAYRRVYALTAPYMTVTDNVDFADLACFWKGNCDTIADDVSRVFASEQVIEDLTAAFGSEPDDEKISTAPYDPLTSWTLVPFEEIEPQRKVITIDGMNILSNQFDADTWPLTAVFGADEHTDPASLPVQNRDASKLTTVVLTGVTAMVRSTAQYMDLDPLYPASLIREPLIEADILHINNEVPFSKVCNENEADLAALRFCSKPGYMALLEDIGVDVLELDGDHFQDFGDDAVLYTLDMYDDAGIPYYGGGHNKTEAQQPLIISHNGNTFAFLGCNGKEIGYAAASDTRPGAVHCDIDLMVEQIKGLKDQGIIPIVTFQHVEVYQEKPVADMRSDFERVHDAGAVIVSGSQSHIPMEFDVYPDSFVHFGLGNLFFDQAFYLDETAEAFIDRHVFYDGKYINTELLTIRFTNCALSHYMEPDDRAALLSRIFKVSEIRGN